MLNTMPLNFWSAVFGLVTVAIFTPIFAAADEPSTAELPVTRVVLFNSGVGFFEHRAEVDGDAKVELKFNVDDINDLLKSMVLQDLGGGKISTVTYGSRDPITKTLKTFAIDLTNNPTLADLLRQVRGEQVDVEAPTKITGIILGVETHKEKVGDNDTVEKEYSEPAHRRRPAERAAGHGGPHQADQRKARRRTAASAGRAGAGPRHGQENRDAQFHGPRQAARAGRLHPGDAPSGRPAIAWCSPTTSSPFLQGWAIVENTTEDDWKDVRADAGQRPADLVRDGPVRAAVRAAAGGRAGVVRRFAAADVLGRIWRRREQHFRSMACKTMQKQAPRHECRSGWIRRHGSICG